MKAYLGAYLVNYWNRATALSEWFDDDGWSATVLPRMGDLAAAAKRLGFADSPSTRSSTRRTAARTRPLTSAPGTRPSSTTTTAFTATSLELELRVLAPVRVSVRLDRGGPCGCDFDDARSPEYVTAQLEAFRRWGMGGEFANYAYAGLADFDYSPYVEAMRSASTPGGGGHRWTRRSESAP
jgi:hypothetical protein